MSESKSEANSQNETKPSSVVLGDVVEEEFKQEVAYKCGKEKEEHNDNEVGNEVDISEVIKHLVIEAQRKKAASRPQSKVFNFNESTIIPNIKDHSEKDINSDDTKISEDFRKDNVREANKTLDDSNKGSITKANKMIDDTKGENVDECNKIQENKNNVYKASKTLVITDEGNADESKEAHTMTSNSEPCVNNIKNIHMEEHEGNKKEDVSEHEIDRINTEEKDTVSI